MTIKELAIRATKSNLNDSIEDYRELALFVDNELICLNHPIGRIVEKVRAKDLNTTYKELEKLGKFALYLLD